MSHSTLRIKGDIVLFKKGDLVAYAAKDFHGMRYIFATVSRDTDSGDVPLRTVESDVPICIPQHVLTKVKTVWQDTMKPVCSKKEMYIRQTNEQTPRWYACMPTGTKAKYLGEDGNMHHKMGEGMGTYFPSKGALIDHFLNIGIDLVELRD